ncbi:PDDEXK family nuclease [Haliea atlantica]
MKTLLFFVLVITGIAFLLLLAKGKGDSRAYPYRKSNYLMSKAERSFYGVLVQAVGNSGVVFSKVRVADVISPEKGLKRADWQRAFNAISSKHFDFIVCEPADCAITLAVELDDSSHGSSKARKRDDLLNGACQSAGLPLLRIKAARSYALAEIQRQIAAAISPTAAVTEETVSLAVAERPAPVAYSTELPASSPSAEFALGREGEAVTPERHEAKPASRVCPKCGKPMVLRKANSGANAGQVFWGCSAFPKCRTRVSA